LTLDSAASGWNTVEREGISIKHPEVYSCRIRKSGRELRPQLLDRFGHAEITTIRDPELRVKL
jgi:magnesium chelatase subunit I